jgi:hypothetical protein
VWRLIRAGLNDEAGSVAAVRGFDRADKKVTAFAADVGGYTGRAWQSGHGSYKPRVRLALEGLCLARGGQLTGKETDEADHRSDGETFRPCRQLRCHRRGCHVSRRGGDRSSPSATPSLVGLRFSRAPDLRLERCKVSFGRNLVPDGKRFESAREAGQHLVEGVELWRVTAIWAVELHFSRWLSFRCREKRGRNTQIAKLTGSL